MKSNKSHSKSKRNVPRCVVCGHIIRSKAALAAGVGAACGLKLLAVRR